MDALILAGGKGTRLRPLTVYTPKPVVPLANRPFLLYQIDVLVRAGIDAITLSLNYQPDKIEDILGDGSDHGVHLRYMTEPTPLGTGGAYKFAAHKNSGTTIVFNGDILTDADIGEVIKVHRDAGADATIVLVEVEDPTLYGLVETGPDGRVTGFQEKPTQKELAGLKHNTINAGIYVLEPSVLNLIPDGESASFEYDVFPRILNDGLKFHSFVLKGRYWRDIGNPASYLQAHHDILARKVSGVQAAGSSSEVATSARIDATSILGHDCLIKPGASITNSVLGPGVHVDEKAVIKDSVVWAYTRIGPGAVIEGAVIGKGSHIGRNVKVGPGSVLGDKASLPDYSTV